MPTNQSSPWGGGKRGACPSVGAHARTQVPSSQTSSELSRRKDQAKPLVSNGASSASKWKQKSASSSVLSVWANEGGRKASAQSHFTAVPDRSPNPPHPLPGIQSPNQVLDSALKPAGTSLTDADVPSPKPVKDYQSRTNSPLAGTKQDGVPLAASQPGHGSAACRREAASGDAQTGPGSLQDLIINGQPILQHAITLMPADGSSSPSVPPLCLTLRGHQGAALGENASSLDRTEVGKRSTASARRVQSAKAATTCRTGNASNNQLLLGPPAVPPPNSRPNTAAAHGSSTCRTISPCANGYMLTVLSATPEKLLPPAMEEERTGVAPAGLLMGSVTNQISAIHLTKQGQPASTTCPSPAPSSPPPTEDGDAQLSGQDGGMQVDGVEEELPDELEDACSDDDDSDYSSITGTSSTSSITPVSGVDEPMSLEAEDDREERPALVPSLFPFIPPTLYFSTANEKVELLPAEQRRLLKWKISTVTPNVVKHTIARSHFKATKKSHDWLGCWGHHMKSVGFKALGEHQKLNHFPGTFQIGRKDRLWRNLSKMKTRFGKQEFSFFPRTFILPQDIKLLRKAWEDGSSRQKWIIKPPASARGIGIQVIHRWSQMPRKRPLLVQRYLHKPYLISGNKFDLRIYVYVTSYDPLRIYIFSDGLVRFASCKYSSSMKTLSNKFMHLTNYSVNKKNSEYQSNSDDKACQGHKWALKALWMFLGAKGVDTSLIWEKIKDIVIKTIIASEPYVNSLLKMHLRTASSCHELFGFDIMLDESLKPWILEVNISPSLHSNTPLDVAIKGQMIRDLLNLAGFRIPNRDDEVAPCSSASSSTSSLCGGSREKTKLDLSANEKVKRAFYLTQRFADQDFLSSVLDFLSPDDVRVLAESEDELTRLGQFERIFPSPSSSRYLRFFESPRYLNILLDQWEQKHWNDRSKGISLLSTLCHRGVHLGITDPDHMWSKCSYISRFDPQRLEPVTPSRPRVVVSQPHDGGSDGEVASVSSPPVSPSPGSSVTSSTCTSPQPGLSLLPQQLASLT